MATLIYDQDCGFCTKSARWIEQKSSDLKIVGSAVCDLESYGLTSDEVAAAVYLVDDNGDSHRGHKAIAEALKGSRVRLLRFAGQVFGLNLLNVPGRIVYSLVAKHRHRLPGSTDACKLYD